MTYEVAYIRHEGGHVTVIVAQERQSDVVRGHRSGAVPRLPAGGLGPVRAVATRRQPTAVRTEVFIDAADQPTFRPVGDHALLASAIQAGRRAPSGRTLLVNVGNTMHSSMAAEWTQGRAIVPLVNRLGIHVFVPGN